MHTMQLHHIRCARPLCSNLTYKPALPVMKLSVTLRAVYQEERTLHGNQTSAQLVGVQVMARQLVV